MRRIDLVCKLLGPFSIALLDAYSTRAAIIVNFAINIMSVGVEYFAIARVYYDVPGLQQAKQSQRAESNYSEISQPPDSHFTRVAAQIRTLVTKTLWTFDLYFHHRAFLPSMACAMLNLTVLSFGGQMVTYLLSAGYTPTQVGIARTLSVFFEVLATWITPWLVGRIGPVRAGLWSSTWQFGMLAAGATVFWGFADNSLVAAGGLMGGTILSRVGLWGFDLSAQLIVQEVSTHPRFLNLDGTNRLVQEVEPQNRGVFSSVEAAWQNAFELLSYVSTIVFFRPEQFKWPSLISVAAVASANGAYATFVYLRRGHLLHLDKLTGCLGTSRSGQRQIEQAIDRITSGRNL
jgi:iron-regulated transporter 1